MQWDLLEEHERAYNKEVCATIDRFTDLFDIVFDKMELYPMAICADVFPSIENVRVEVPIHMQKYYEGIIAESYKEKNQKKFCFEMKAQPEENGELSYILKYIFDFALRYDKKTRYLGKYEEDIMKLAEEIKNITGTSDVKYFSLGGHDLNVLQNLYLGILFSGWVLQCGNYAILIFLGTNE